MKHIQFSQHRPAWLAVVLLAGILLAATTMAAARPNTSDLVADVLAVPDTPGGIEGVLFEPDGTTPVEGGWIDIHDMGGQPWMGTGTDPGGYFAIPNLPPGEYVLEAHPPPGNPFAASLPVVVEVFPEQWSMTALQLTDIRIDGYVRDCDAEPELRIEGAAVVAHDPDWTIERWTVTNPNGDFKLGGLDIGMPYFLEVFPPPESEYAPTPPIEVIPITTGVVLELCIPPVNVVGVVHDPAGAPVPGAGIAVYHDDFWMETGADEFGEFLFRGLPPGEYWIHAAPPWDVQGLLSSEPFTITITQPDTLIEVGVITLPYAPKTIVGEVVNAETGLGVPDAVVWAHQLDGPGYAEGPTNPAGEFALGVVGGEWHVGVAPMDPHAPWIFPGPPAWVFFDWDDTPQTSTVVLEVIPTDAWVTGQIVCPGGMPCDGELPHDAVQVELRNDELQNGVPIGPDFHFEIPIPSGWYELVVHVHHPMLQGPHPVPVFVGPGQSLDAGAIELIMKDALITGQVVNEFGVGVPEVPVIGWQPDGFGWGWAETSPNGTYTMPVVGGEWFVEPHPGPELPYVFRQHPQMALVAPGGTMTGVDFSLTLADALIEGIAVDAGSSERVWGLDGWAWTEQYVGPPQEFEFFSEAPLWDGGFSLKVQGGEEYAVGLNLPPHAPYVSGGVSGVNVAPGDTVTVVVPLDHKDALFEGHLIDFSTGLPPGEPVWAEIFGEDEQGHWVGTGIHPDSAGYELAVISGTWHLRVWVDPASGYIALPEPVTATIQAGEVAVLDFPIWPINTSISGVVLQPDGTPAEAFVFAEGESPVIGHFEAHGWSDEFGHFELMVPEGVYMVGAALPGEELEMQHWLNPPPLEGVVATVPDPATGLELRFRQLDGEIHGTVTFTPSVVVTASHPAYVWGWAESGEWAETEAHVIPGTNTFSYTLHVISDTVWHVGAVYEAWDNGVYYESAEAVVPVAPPSGQATQDLVLDGPWTLPQPFIVSFDGTQMQTIVLPDGTEIAIPPGSLVVSGTVTLYIFPTHELHPEPGQEVIGAGYEIWATDENGQEITQFNQNVVITFQYPPDAVLEAQGISELRLVPVYYSTLVGHWILAESYVVDTANNEITLQVDHFTKFGTAFLSAEQTYNIYLPSVIR